MGYLDNFYEIEVGNTPESYDVAIVSINLFRGLGELNKIPLDAFGFDYKILDNLELEKGFDIYTENNKTIIFIVTVGQRSVLNSLKGNLQSAFTTFLEKLSNKKIWLPLMGTGSGKLTFQESFLTIKQVLYEYKEYIEKYNIQVTISFPDDNKSIDYYNEIKIIDDKYFNLIKELKNVFYLVGTTWGNEDQAERFYEEGIWENGYEDGKYSALVNKINVNDILIHKSSFPTKDKKSILRIKAFGVVKENSLDGRTLIVEWGVKLEPNIDIDSLGFYRDTISRVSDKNLNTIFESINSDFKEYLYGLFTKKNKSIHKSQKNESVTRLAGLIADSDTGEDYLDIKEDINAFARVIAAKSFEPPLAVALLGKWGSGKSFFMRKLKEDIQILSKENPQKAFCEGVAHVHFNAWSYMDANLWASIVTRIFGALDEYINNDKSLSEKEKEALVKEIYSKLNILKEGSNNLIVQKEVLKNRIQVLETKKNINKEQLQKRINAIKKTSLFDIVKKVDEDFKVQEKIEDTLNNNPTFVNSIEKFEKIVPRQYWENPTSFYNELKSIHTFIKAFFQRDKWKTNLFWFIGIVILILITPLFTGIINLLLSWQNFTISNETWVTITIIGGIITRIIDTYLKLKKQIAPFWKIKEDYEAEKAKAIFELEQEEKALRLEIENYREEIIQIDQQINTNKELIATLEFRIQSTSSTEALYNFIEKRANSEDYKKHLGIVSLIRKDFEILSGLLTQHKTELVTSANSEEFKKLFHDKKPLERIILYIDDLDRCPEERVVEVLEAVNLLMAFPLFVVVVGVDPRWVKTALQKKYKNQFTKYKDNEDAISPSNYLEKIFQVPFHLKDAEDVSIKNMIKSLVHSKTNFIKQPEIIDQETENGPVISPPIGKSPMGTLMPGTFAINKKKNPRLPKKETIEALEISDRESQIMQNMSEIIGNNPRAVKRFVNIYRIVKTHEEFNFTNETREKDLAVVMFLLVLPMGNFKDLIESFESFIGKETIAFETLNDYVKTPSSLGGKKNDDLLKRKTELKMILQNSGIKTLEMDVELFRKYNPFIKRFTFKNI